MKKLLMATVMVSVFGFSVDVPPVQAVERSTISLEQAHERFGKRSSGRIGLSAYTRERGYRNPGMRNDSARTERRRSVNIAPRKASSKGTRRYNTTTRTQFETGEESLVDFYRRPRYMRR